MFNWLMDFSTGVEMGWIERVACALLLTAVISSAVMIVFVVLGYFVKSMVARYWMVLIGQLSCLPILAICLFCFQGVNEMEMESVIAKEVVTETPKSTGNQATILINDEASQFESSSTFKPTNETAIDSELAANVATNGDLTEEFILDLKAPEEASLREIVMSTILEYSNTIVWIWFLGVALLLIKWSLGAYGLVQLRKSGNEPSEDLKGIFSSLCERYVKGSVRLRESAAIVSPMVVGWLKPVVFVPCGFMARMSPDQVEAILLHELAHIRRHDYFWNILQRLSEVLFFFNPILWWSGKMVRQLREEVCDGFVVAQTQDPKKYAEALYALEKARGQWLAVMAVGSNLKRRFEILLGKRKFRSLPSFTELAMLVVLGFVCFLPMTADADDEEMVDRVPDKVVTASPFGRVVDVDGNAVSGAKVMLYYGKNKIGYNGDFHPDTGVIEEVISGKNGEYRFNSDCVYSDLGVEKWADHYAVIASHPDWAIGSINLTAPATFEKERPEPEEQVVMLLRPVSQTLNVILKGEKDIPLKGAKVYLARWFVDEGGDESESLLVGADLGLSSGITDENGKVTLAGLPPLKCCFVVTHPDVGRSWKTRKYDQKNDWKTKCFPAAGVSGRVVKPNGEGLANELLRIKSEGSWIAWYVKTDANGKYAIRDLYGKGHNASRGGGGEGKYTMRVDSGDWLAEKVEFKLNPAEFKELEDLKVSKGESVVVNGKNSLTGEPLAFAAVRYSDAGDQKIQFTDVNGIASFTVLPGQSRFRMSPPKGFYVSPERSSNLLKDVFIDEVRGKQIVAFTLEAKPVGRIEGVVMSPVGSEAFDGEIKFLLDYEDIVYVGDNYSRSFKGELGRIDSNKRHFHIDNIPTDKEYIVHAKDDKQGLSGTTIWKPGGGDFVISLSKQISQKVILRQSDGKLLKNQTIHYGEIKNELVVKVVRDLVTSDSGEVTLPNLREDAEYCVSLPNKDFYRALFKLDRGKTLDLMLTDKVGIIIFDEEGQELEVERFIGIETIGKTQNGYRDNASKNINNSRAISKHILSFARKREQNRLRISVKLKSGDLAVTEGLITESEVMRLKVTERISNKVARLENLDTERKQKDKKARITVVDEGGKPIKGAKLSSTEYQNPQLIQGQELVFKETRISSNAKGEFEPVLFDRYLRIDTKGYATRWIPRSVLLDGPVRVTLQSRTSCEGVLRNKAGKSIADRVLHFVTEQKVYDPRYMSYGCDESLSNLKPLRIGVKTDAKGKFSAVLEPGKWRLVGSASGDFIIDESFELKLGKKLELEPTLKPSANLIVKVRDKETSELVAGAVIYLQKSMGPSSLTHLSPEKEVEDGELAFKGLLPGKYTVIYIQALKFEDMGKNKYIKANAVNIKEEKSPFPLGFNGEVYELELKQGIKTLDVELTSGVLIKGIVSSELIKDNSQITVGVLENRGSYSTMIAGVRCKKNGEFSCYAPASKDFGYRLIAYESKNISERIVAPAVSEQFAIRKGMVKEFTLELKPGGTLIGRVIDSNNKPLAGQTIGIQQEVDEQSGRDWTKTDKDGSFVMKGIRPGRVDVRFHRDGGNLDKKGIQIKIGQAVDIGDWVIPEKEK